MWLIRYLIRNHPTNSFRYLLIHFLIHSPQIYPLKTPPGVHHSFRIRSHPQIHLLRYLRTCPPIPNLHRLSYIGSVSNGSKFPGRFRVRFHPKPDRGNGSYHTKNPDHWTWAGFTTKNPAFQVHIFASN
jgi:hypothetical protein